MSPPRRLFLLVWATLAASLIAPTAGSAAPTSLDSFTKPLKGWKERGELKAKRLPWRGDKALILSKPGKKGGRFSRRLPSRRWALSLDLALAPGARVTIGLGDRKARHKLTLLRFRSGGTQLQSGERRVALAPTETPPSGNWVHLLARANADGVTGTIGGHPFTLRGKAGRALHLGLTKRQLRVDDLIATKADGPGLLLHRLADLHTRLEPDKFLIGADEEDQLVARTRVWTRGFFAGALWQAAALTPGDLFEQWALERTVANFGYETADTHDQGFLYELTSVAAYRRECRTPSLRVGELCQRLRASALAAADRLMVLAGSNTAGGTIPTGASHPAKTPELSDTLIDSMMNLPLLYWASNETGNGFYREVAARHAQRVEELLVRPDGSTAQSVHMYRSTGEVERVHTHQGLSPDSTWARGQAWAVYGFTTTAAALLSSDRLAAAERLAAYIDAKLPPTGVPRYDYLAPPEAGDATSAGVITAAGLFRLGALCKQWRGPGPGCRQPNRWQELARYMLSRSLRRVSREPPLGYFRRSIDLDTRIDGAEADHERVFGLYYALEAIKLSRRSAQPQAH